MDCFYCKGKLEQEFLAFTAELERGIVVIKDVPTDVCEKCGQSFYSNEVMAQIEGITNKLKNAFTEIAVVKYAESIVA